MPHAPLSADSPPQALFAEVQRLRQALAAAQARSDPPAPAPGTAAPFLLERAMLEAIFRSAPIGLSVIEAAGRRPLVVSDDVKRLSGRDLGGQDGLQGAGAVHPDGRPFDETDYPIMRSLLQGETVQRELVTVVRPDGERQRLEVSSLPLRDGEGAVMAAVAVLVDVEERERALERQQLLIYELAHRMKNTLAMVQAIVSQTLRAAPSLEVGREQVLERFAALARAQDLLTRGSWESACMQTVVREALGALVGGDGRVRVDGPPVRLSARAAMNFTLALHELTSNALKFGALSTPEGRVEVAWSVRDRRLEFSWSEAGGPQVAQPARRGFGSRLLDILSRTFDAEGALAYAPGGVSWRVHADLDAMERS